MEIRKTYKFEYEQDGKILHGVSSGFLPEYATNVLETIDVLYASIGKNLKRIATEEIGSYFVLKDDDSMDNYEEIDIEENEVEDADNN